MKELAEGWTFDQYNGAVCHFEHFPLDQADEMSDEREYIHLVETINYTLAGNDDTVHHNRYFALGLASAIAMAAKMEIDWQEVAEEVIGIRKATEEEVQMYFRVSRYFDEKMPEALSIKQANELPDD